MKGSAHPPHPIKQGWAQRHALHACPRTDGTTHPCFCIPVPSASWRAPGGAAKRPCPAPQPLQAPLPGWMARPMPFAVCNKGTAPRTHALLKMFDAALPISSLPIARRIARRMPSLVTCNCIVTACAMPERPTHPLTAIAGMDSAPHVFLVTRNGRATACAMPERPTPPRPLPDGWHATSPRRVCGPAYPPSMPCWQGRSAPHPLPVPGSARCTAPIPCRGGWRAAHLPAASDGRAQNAALPFGQPHFAHDEHTGGVRYRQASIPAPLCCGTAVNGEVGRIPTGDERRHTPVIQFWEIHAPFGERPALASTCRSR